MGLVETLGLVIIIISRYDIIMLTQIIHLSKRHILVKHSVVHESHKSI